MFLLFAFAHATVPESLATRRIGVGIEVPITGLPVSAQSTAGAPVVSVQRLFAPRFSGRFQFGRLGLAPQIGLEAGASQAPEGDGGSWWVSGGLDARAYPVSVGPVHLVGIAGLAGRGSLQQFEPAGDALKSRAYSMEVDVGAGVEWTPSPRFSLSGDGRTSVVTLAYQDEVEGWGKQWQAGLGALMPRVAAHVWF